MIVNLKEFGSFVNVSPSYLFNDEDEGTELTTNECAVQNKWIPLVLLSVKSVNYNTAIFEFSLPPEKIKLRLPIGGFLLMKAPNSELDGSDAIRPYTSITDENLEENNRKFHILCKRYDEWGVREGQTGGYSLFTRTDHSYRPKGSASSYLHSLQPGDKALFKFSKQCFGRIGWPLRGVTTITMVAVGVGIAPMIQIIRTALLHSHTLRIVLLYGIRDTRDILMHELLEEWQESYPERFLVVYCIGSRWANIHFGVKTKNEYVPPPTPKGVEHLKHTELGWVDESKILKYGYPPGEGTRVLVCGLPGVYQKLCGPRDDETLAENSYLFRLGYSQSMVTKL